MTSARKALSVLLVAAMIAMTPSGLWATSAVPDPGAIGDIPINPSASGTKLSGPLTLAYEEVVDFDCGFASGNRRIRNIFAVLVMHKGNDAQTFNGDLKSAGFPVDVCFGTGNLDPDTVSLIGLLIANRVIPSFFACNAGSDCPAFEVKSVTNILSSGGGGLSADMVLAVK